MKSGTRLLASFCGVALSGGLGWIVGTCQHPPTRISFVSVGQGDCTVFTSEGYTILLDDGPATPKESAAERIIQPWLEQNSYQHVDAILLSHPDEDHVGGTSFFLNKYPGVKVIVSDQFENDPEMGLRLKKWGIAADAITWIPKTCSMAVGAGTLSIDCPDRPAGGDANDGSMFVKISVGGAAVTLSGDAPKLVERRVEQDMDWTSQILHVGHHGSHTASDESWLEKVHPRVAIISVGRNNRYGHPSPETLNRLEDDHIPVLRTDRDGTINFRYDGTEFVRD